MPKKPVKTVLDSFGNTVAASAVEDPGLERARNRYSMCASGGGVDRQKQHASRHVADAGPTGPRGPRGRTRSPHTDRDPSGSTISEVACEGDSEKAEKPGRKQWTPTPE